MIHCPVFKYVCSQSVMFFIIIVERLFAIWLVLGIKVGPCSSFPLIYSPALHNAREEPGTGHLSPTLLSF